MPYLGDFLGSLLAEVTLSRMHADREAVRLAELYAGDPILKHFPVPRFRTPTVSMRVPVAVAELESPKATKGLPGIVDPARLKPVFIAALDEELAPSPFTLSREARRRIARAVETKAQALTDAQEPPASVRGIADELTEMALAELPQPALGEEVDPQVTAFRYALRNRLEQALIAIRLPPPRLNVLVTEAELREAGPGLVQLELTLSEDAVEWTVIDQLGQRESRLVPE
jgi:hypothetical protein